MRRPVEDDLPRRLLRGGRVEEGRLRGGRHEEDGGVGEEVGELLRGGPLEAQGVGGAVEFLVWGDGGLGWLVGSVDRSRPRLILCTPTYPHAYLRGEPPVEGAEQGGVVRRLGQDGGLVEVEEVDEARGGVGVRGGGRPGEEGLREAEHGAVLQDGGGLVLPCVCVEVVLVKGVCIYIYIQQTYGSQYNNAQGAAYVPSPPARTEPRTTTCHPKRSRLPLGRKHVSALFLC